jgi:ADP-heptose:LPS heptosyltransferase
LPHGWLRSPAKILQLRRRLRALSPSVAIDAQGLSKSAIAAWLSGAPKRIGMGGQWAREASPWLNNQRVPVDNMHPIPRALKLLEPLGVASTAVEFNVPVSDQHREKAAEVVNALGANSGYVLVASGAGWPSKLWPAERFAQLSKYLGTRWNLPTLFIWGNEEERKRVEQIALTACDFARIVPKLTLLELAALAEQSRFCIGSDTGPLHLAAAVGTPCIGLYGPWPAEMHGPYGPQHINLQKMSLAGTTRQRRQASGIYMEAISVADVCHACDAMAARDMGARTAARGTHVIETK